MDVVVLCLQGLKAPSNIVVTINCFQRWQIWHNSSSSVTTSNWLEHPIASVPISVLASSSSEASSLSSSHSSNSIPSTDMGNPVTGTHPQIHVTGESNTPTTPSATSLPPFSLPPYLQSPKESSNNANFQGMCTNFCLKKWGKECNIIVIRNSSSLGNGMQFIERLFNFRKTQMALCRQ